MNHQFARAAIIMTLAALGFAGCGGDDDVATTTATATAGQPQATDTATATQTQATATPDSTTPVQREAVVPDKEATLQTGDIGMKVKVLKVVDPVAASVDRAQKGNKLVGVFVRGKTDGVVEATRTSSGTTLETTDGKITGIRVIADGDCAGGFSANELLLATKKPVTGCIGFEIPKNATPKSITIELVGPAGAKQATWTLPKTR